MGKMMFYCSKCRQMYSFNKGKDSDVLYCQDCNSELIETEIPREAWVNKSAVEKESIKDEFDREVQEEIEKQEFISSHDDLYEYDIVTILNKDHGQIDKKKIKEVIMSHARKGWKLHTVYSNELGKNALAVLGLGLNTTACEDVLIFERKISK